jgi:hypothetical protein
VDREDKQMHRRAENESWRARNIHQPCDIPLELVPSSSGGNPSTSGALVALARDPRLDGEKTRGSKIYKPMRILAHINRHLQREED